MHSTRIRSARLFRRISWYTSDSAPFQKDEAYCTPRYPPGFHNSHASKQTVCSPIFVGKPLSRLRFNRTVMHHTKLMLSIVLTFANAKLSYPMCSEYYIQYNLYF